MLVKKVTQSLVRVKALDPVMSSHLAGVAPPAHICKNVIFGKMLNVIHTKDHGWADHCIARSLIVKAKQRVINIIIRYNKTQ